MNIVKPLFAAAAAIAVSIPAAMAQNAQPELEEIVVIGQGIGTLRLNATNSAGGRLGLSPFDTPASVDVITKDEIAAEVFGKGSDFDPNQDSLVRVYVHNLRQKLDNYYSGEGGSQRLVIPKGEYRLTVVSAEEAPVATQPVNRAPPLWVAIVVAALCINLIALVVIGRGDTSSETIYDEVARSPIWYSFLDDDLPFLIVVGDYYIFGELDQFGNVERLVRDFSINSAADLDDQFVYEPELMESYLDLDLTYVPDASASALKDVLRIVYRSDKPVRITPMSELSVADLRNSHIIYIGYISAMDKLTEFVFASSGLQLGETYDELLVTESGEMYTSGAGIPRADRPR